MSPLLPCRLQADKCCMGILEPRGSENASGYTIPRHAKEWIVWRDALAYSAGVLAGCPSYFPLRNMPAPLRGVHPAIRFGGEAGDDELPWRAQRGLPLRGVFHEQCLPLARGAVTLPQASAVFDHGRSGHLLIKASQTAPSCCDGPASKRGTSRTPTCQVPGLNCSSGRAAASIRRSRSCVRQGDP